MPLSIDATDFEGFLVSLEFTPGSVNYNATLCSVSFSINEDGFR